MNTKEIEAVVMRYAQQIHDQNETEFKRLWTGTDADILISGTKIFYGVESIYSDFLAGLIHDHYESILLINDGMKISLLTADTAVVLFSYHTECIRRNTKEPYRMAGIETQVLVKKEDGWKIAHIQYHGKSMEDQ